MSHPLRGGFRSEHLVRASSNSRGLGIGRRSRPPARRPPSRWHLPPPGNEYVVDLHLFTLNVVEGRGSSIVGEPHDERWYKTTVVHELAATMAEMVTGTEPSGWRFSKAPRWFVQGLEQELASACGMSKRDDSAFNAKRAMTRTAPNKPRGHGGPQQQAVAPENRAPAHVTGRPGKGS